MFLTTLWLLYLQAFVIGHFCQFCLLSALVTTILTVLVIVAGNISREGARKRSEIAVIDDASVADLVCTPQDGHAGRLRNQLLRVRCRAIGGSSRHLSLACHASSQTDNLSLPVPH